MTFSQLYGAQLDIELASQDGGLVSGASNNLFTRLRRKKAINDAMHNFERIANLTPILGSIPLVDGTAEYDLFANFPDYLSLEERREPAIKRVTTSGAVSYIEGDSFSRRSPTWLDRATPGWQADPKGTPSAWYLRDDSGTTWLGVDPAPNPAAVAETWTLVVPYLASSRDLIADTDVPFTSLSGVPALRLVPYHQALVHYAAGLLEPLRKNYAGAQRQMGLYAGYIAQYETKKRKDGPSQITMRRSYLREARRPGRGVDPHRWP